MKKTIILLACILSIVSVSAQTLFDNENNHPYFGARAGIDVTSASDGNGVFNNGCGFQVGAIYNLPIKMNFYFEPGLSVFYDTFGQQVTALGEDLEQYNIDGSIRNFGFRVPFNFGFHFDFTDEISVCLFTGPQLNWSLSAKSHWSNVKGVEQLPSESVFGEGGFKHFDLQWNFGVGLNYNQYYIAMSGAAGITKVMDTKAIDFRRNIFTLSLGYNF